MTITVRLLGAEVLHVSTDREQVRDERGDAVSAPVGFGTVQMYLGHGNEEDR